MSENRYKKNDRVIVVHPSNRGQTGTITACLGGGYHVHLDRSTESGGIYYIDKDLERLEDRPAEMKKDHIGDPQAHARAVVQVTHYPNLDIDDIYVVWYCYTLGSWKALISTNVKDNCYYEVTHDAAKNCTYIDQYGKITNTCVDLSRNISTSTDYPEIRSI